MVIQDPLTPALSPRGEGTVTAALSQQARLGELAASALSSGHGWEEGVSQHPGGLCHSVPSPLGESVRGSFSVQTIRQCIEVCIVRFLIALLVFAGSGGALKAQDIASSINALGASSFSDREAAVAALSKTGDPNAASIIEALSRGDLYIRKSDRKVFIGKESGGKLLLTDPVTSANAGSAPSSEFEKIRLNNALRRAIEEALGALTLLSKDPTVRSSAAQSIFKAADPSRIDLLTNSIARESDPGVKKLMQEARAAAVMKSDRPEAEKLSAIQVLKTRGDQDALGLLQAAASDPSDAVQAAAANAAEDIRSRLALWDMVQNVWYGLSLGSVLLLAAAGLAITFGVMGVINMAHGELVMLGAYTTFVVQEGFRAYLPSALDYSLFVAIPASFLFVGAVGIFLEQSIIRFLYKRPLETLLATWGVSLILQQAVRNMFGPSNREVTTPSWMSGSFEVTSGLALTSNRMAIVVFTALVFGILFLVIRRTRFGLEMRAVTQNRPMANSMGIKSGRIDALTFGLGAGIAGIAGVALSQIDNVSPNLGQSYIVDSFLVVVFGGVGNLFGTLIGALSLGIANKFLEPFAGAVLAKILILVAVILFIQRRPRGLFALKGRAVEA
jgi:urea transport system permease protein